MLLYHLLRLDKNNQGIEIHLYSKSTYTETTKIWSYLKAQYFEQLLSKQRIN